MPRQSEIERCAKALARAVRARQMEGAHTTLTSIERTLLLVVETRVRSFPQADDNELHSV